MDTKKKEILTLVNYMIHLLASCIDSLMELTDIIKKAD